MVAKKFLSLMMIIFSVFIGSAFAEGDDVPSNDGQDGGGTSTNTTATGSNDGRCNGAYCSTDPRVGLPLYTADDTETSSLGGSRNAKPATTSYVAGAYNALLRRKIETEIIIKNLNPNATGLPVVPTNNKAFPGNVISKIEVGSDNSLEVSYSQVEIPISVNGAGQNSQTYVPIWVE